MYYEVLLMNVVCVCVGGWVYGGVHCYSCLTKHVVSSWLGLGEVRFVSFGGWLSALILSGWVLVASVWVGGIVWAIAQGGVVTGACLFGWVLCLIGSPCFGSFARVFVMYVVYVEGGYAYYVLVECCRRGSRATLYGGVGC